MSFTELSIKEETQRFKSHLDIEENNRIIFSGIFGIGKTFFINKFFEANSSDYISIKLNPINYSVSANQDIFELIKFDIGFQLLAMDIDYDQIDFEKLFSSQFYIVENYIEVVKVLTKNLSKIDKNLNAITSSAFEIGQKLSDFNRNIQKDENKELTDFLDFFRMDKGSPREQNNITELLCSLIASLRQLNPKKEIVLIIDDLDRIDPEHLFRIMNIFSAHYDYQGYEAENKFDFDKVILICDISNVRGIFHNKYGADIDFAGYIDKFYSTEIFNYRFSSVIIENLEGFFRSINSEDKEIVRFFENGDSYFEYELKFFLVHFIGYNIAGMRTLISFLKQKLTLSELDIKLGMAASRLSVKNSPIFTLFSLLESLMGGQENLTKAFQTCIQRCPFVFADRYNGWSDRRIGNIISILDSNNNGLKISKNSYSYKDKDLNIHAMYKIEPVNGNGFQGDLLEIGTEEQVFENEKEKDIYGGYYITKIPYFAMFKKAYGIFKTMPRV